MTIFLAAMAVTMLVGLLWVLLADASFIVKLFPLSVAVMMLVLLVSVVA